MATKNNPELKDRKNAEPQMGNIGRVLKSKKGSYYYIVESQMEGNLRIRWITESGGKPAYSYTRVIKISQIGKEYFEAELTK